MAEKKTTKKVVAKKATTTVKEPVKKTLAKKEIKTEKPAVKKAKTEKVTTPVTNKVYAGLKVDLIDLSGKVAGQMALPEEVFGVKVNTVLLAQAARVYLNNNRQGDAATKTRGEVVGSTRKIYRQKGTGRARHGGIRAPIFVKGGIAHGPKPRDYSLSLPKNMKKAALASALTSRLQDGHVTVVSGFASLAPKTKPVADMFDSLSFSSKTRSILFVMPKDTENIFKAVRNLLGVEVTTAERLTTYEVLTHKNVFLMKEAIDVLAKRVAK